MSDHKFEQKVGQKLDDLTLTPSAKSWENIERELRKDKRRPAPVFWLPLLLLGLGAIGYFMFSGANKTNENVAAQIKNKTINTIPASPVSPTPREVLPDSGGEVSVNEPQDNIPAKSGDYKQHRAFSSIESRKRTQKFTSTNKTSTNKNLVNTSTGTNIPALPGSSGSRDQSSTFDKEIAATDSQGVIPARPDSAAKSGTIPTDEGVNDVDSAIAAAPKLQKKKTKKWSFGISASGGVSSLSEGKLSFNNSQIATVPLNRVPSYNFASPAVVPPPSAPPSKIYPAFSFGLGLTTKYQLSKRFALSAGINYLQLNTISKVGYKFEQSNNYQFTTLDRTGAEVMYLPPVDEQTRDYDNKYHFIEVPLNLHTRINKSEKLPVYWNAGISISKLIKSNSLHYDEVERLYYSNDELLKKTQTAVSTGFSFVVFNKTSRPLWIGPTVRSNISQAFKNEIHAGNKHFMGIGLDVKWFLK